MTTIVAAITTAVVLVALCVLSGRPLFAVILVAVLGFTGMTANPVLISLAVRFGRDAPTLASGLSTAAFNFGTAIGSWLAGFALASSLGESGPAGWCPASEPGEAPAEPPNELCDRLA
ncbi:hypothetical protein [Amycolatopsis acidicola]|uniref:hypothetical protein n=1 Tax=Amycolatopsis acidicola TaxID=2596893 RepID=UPI001FB85325|nr:hypothetical protein [Amycolatopsis acidicola]